ncbi:MAG: hypothetical protein IH948_00140 [Bacteroidetes bacterium]|nr:hypothetical protein [Bacteroidota bacterium]
MKVKGIVSAVSQKGDRYGILIDEKWYNGQGNPGVNKGAEIEIEFETDGKWNSVTGLNVLKEAEESKESSTGFGRKPESIIKTDCYRMAVDLCIADKIEFDKIEATAEDINDKIKE